MLSFYEDKELNYKKGNANKHYSIEVVPFCLHGIRVDFCSCLTGWSANMA